MSRLASFKGPSTPSPSPVSQGKRGSKHQPQSPGSPSRPVESPIHRKMRTLLQDLKAICRLWDDLVMFDGLKAAKKLVDTRTELQNELALFKDRPKTRIVGPKVAIMEQAIAELDTCMAKLEKQFRRMDQAVENLESLVAEAHRSKGWSWTEKEPLWFTWTTEKFVSSIGNILIPYHRSLELHRSIAQKIRSHSLPFEESRELISQWVRQADLEELGWENYWEDVCAAEVERWDE